MLKLRPGLLKSSVAKYDVVCRHITLEFGADTPQTLNPASLHPGNRQDPTLMSDSSTMLAIAPQVLPLPARPGYLSRPPKHTARSLGCFLNLQGRLIKLTDEKVSASFAAAQWQLEGGGVLLEAPTAVTAVMPSDTPLTQYDS